MLFYGHAGFSSEESKTGQTVSKLMSPFAAVNQANLAP